MRDSLTDIYRGRPVDDVDPENITPMQAFFGGRNRRGGLIMIVLVVVALLLFHHQSANSTGTGPTASRKVATIGQKVEDDHLAFKVTKVTCDVRHIGTPTVGLGPDAGNQFCIVDADVSTVGIDEVQFSDAYQYVYATNGDRYSDNGGAAYFLKGTNNGQFVKPGAPITVRIPFELPNGQHIHLIVLHDSAFSPGASVKVG